MAVKFAIFDVGQVCYPYTLAPLNSCLKDLAADKKVFAERGGVFAFDYKPFMKGQRTFEAFCEDLCRHCGVDYSAQVARVIDEAMHKGVGAFFEETLAVMDDLRGRGVEICLLSNALPNLCDTAARLVAPDKAFVSYKLGLLKPDVEIFKTVLRRLGAVPRTALMVDDKAENIAAAKNAGMRGIVFNRKTICEDVQSVLAAEE